jgi:spindle assembly abnormal protein 6
MGFEIEEHGKLVGGMENSSTLFEKVVPVRVNKANSEDRHMDLTARFIMGLSKIHRTTKVLQVQITNELDPFFFYSLEVNEDDFQSLKVEQCILVDFATFPYKFIELLEQCIASASNDSSRGTGRFLAVLHIRTGDSTFTVVETNQFKHLSHLSLVFRQGNDSVIKQFLAGRLAEYKASGEKNN